MKTKILIVDDEPDFRLILSDILNRAGYETSQAQDGLEAVEILKKESPHLLLVDWNMPNMTGPELCRHIRQTPPIQTLPIIMLTVRHQNSDHAEGIHQGADLYLTKPIDAETLLIHIKALLRRSAPLESQ